jgi:hypothetical protein
MPYDYTLPQAIAAAGNKTLSAAIITEILGDASKSASHADAHMKSEDFWTGQRTGKKGAALGTTAEVDSHLKSAYKKREKHSMFDSPVSSVEAITAALNTEIGKLALTTLMGQDDGIDLYSRTAVATMGNTKQFNRANVGGTVTMNKVDAEYVVVCLRKTTPANYLMIASAYPVASDDTSRIENAGMDWYQYQSTDTVIRQLAKTAPPVVPW